MQSKIVINILAICACSGLTAFFALNTIDFINALASEKGAIERQELLREEDVIAKQTETLLANLNQVIAKKEALEKSIAERVISRTELQETLSNLENEKVLAISDVKALSTEKLKLTSILKDLREQIEDKKTTEIIKYPEPNQRPDSGEKLYLELTELKEQNKILNKELIVLRNNSAQSLSSFNLALGDLTLQLDEEKNKSAINKTKSKKEIVELTRQIKLLGIEENRNLLKLRAANALLLKQLKMEQDKRESLLKSDKEINNLKHLKSNFEKLNGLRVIFSGNMIYDDQKRQIVFRADNSVGIPIYQDDFTGSIAGKCGLPIDKEIQNRCSATIIAEFVLEKSGLFLRGKEIVEIVKK